MMLFCTAKISIKIDIAVGPPLIRNAKGVTQGLPTFLAAANLARAR